MFQLRRCYVAPTTYAQIYIDSFKILPWKHLFWSYVARLEPLTVCPPGTRSKSVTKRAEMGERLFSCHRLLLTKTWRIQWTYQGSNLCIFSMTKKRLLMAHFWATVLGYFRCLQDLGYFRCLEIVGMDSGSFIWKDEQPSGKVRVILKSSRRRYPLTPRKTNMTIKQSNHLKMLLEMVIFRCHVSFFFGG